MNEHYTHTIMITSGELATLAATLATPRRAAIFLLVLHTPLSTKEIHERTGYPLSRVSTYLNELHDIGLVYAHRDGKSVLYGGTEKAKRLLASLS